MPIHWNLLLIMNIILGEGYRFQRWETNWKHPDFQNLMVTVEYDATDAPIEVLWPDTQNKSHSLQSTLNQTKDENENPNILSSNKRKNECPYTCIKNVNISIDIDDEDTGILFMNNEMEPLIEYCQVWQIP